MYQARVSVFFEIGVAKKKSEKNFIRAFDQKLFFENLDCLNSRFESCKILEQFLSSFSSQGVWLYRIDSPALLPCMQADLQPPYCDARSPSLVNRPPPLHSSPPPATKTTTEPTKSSSSAASSSTIPAPTSTTTTVAATITTPVDEQQQLDDGIQPEEHIVEQTVDPQRQRQQQQQKQEHRVPPLTADGWLPLSGGGSEAANGERKLGAGSGKAAAPSKQHGKKKTPPLNSLESIGTEGGGGTAAGFSSSRKPAIVTIQSKEIEEMPPDAFDDANARRPTTTSPALITTMISLTRGGGGLQIEEDEEDDQQRVPELIVPELVNAPRPKEVTVQLQQPPYTVAKTVLPTFVQEQSGDREQQQTVWFAHLRSIL